MPRVGFGTAGLGERTGEAVRAALAAGYRLLDSAQAREWYREDLVGEALAATALPREDVFVTTKIHPRHLGYEQTAARVAHSLRELHTDRVDLLLLHYPSCWGDLCGGVAPAGTWRESWRALEAAKAAGQASALGVSNFDAAQLLELLAWAKEPPDVVQAHSDPFSQARHAQRCVAVRPGSRPLRRRTGSCSGCARSTAWCSRHTARWGCSGGARAITATPCCMRPWWKPPPWRTRSRLRRWSCDGRCTKDRRATVLLLLGFTSSAPRELTRLRRPQCIIPKTGNPEHMRMNRELGFALTEQELADIDALDGNLPPKDQYQ